MSKDGSKLLILKYCLFARASTVVWPCASHLHCWHAVWVPLSVPANVGRSAAYDGPSPWNPLPWWRPGEGSRFLVVVTFGKWTRRRVSHSVSPSISVNMPFKWIITVSFFKKERISVFSWYNCELALFKVCHYTRNTHEPSMKFYVASLSFSWWKNAKGRC